MKLISFRAPGGGAPRTGVVLGARVLDVGDWIAAQPVSEQARRHNEAAGIDAPAGGMLRLLQADALAALAAHVALAQKDAQVDAQKDAQKDAHKDTQKGTSTRFEALDELRLLAPVPRPGKIIGIGRNYADHAAETGVAAFEKPRIIFKMPSAVSAPGVDVVRPASVAKMDFEAELAVVIGGYGRNVARDQALSLVAGYTILNDLSAREFQFDVNPAQTTFAKSVDGFAPMGPWLVTRDEIPDPQALQVDCWLNGEQMQHGHTSAMIFPVAEQIAYLSRFMTLEPGDVITTGTPAGVGAFRTPPLYLKPGDRLRLQVSGIGTLEHGIIAGEDT